MAKAKKKSNTDNFELTQEEKLLIMQKRKMELEQLSRQGAKVLLERTEGVYCRMGFPEIELPGGISEKPKFIDNGPTNENYTICSKAYYEKLLELAAKKRFIGFHLGQLRVNQERLRKLGFDELEIANVDWEKDSEFCRDELKVLQKISDLLKMPAKKFEKEIAKITDLRFLIMLAERLPLEGGFENQYKVDAVTKRWLELDPHAKETQLEILSFSATDRIREMLKRGSFQTGI